MRAGRRRAVVAGCWCGDLGGGLALWTSFIFQSILNNAFRLAVGVRVHQIKKIASNYPINIIIFAVLQHYIMKQSGFSPCGSHQGRSHASKWKLDCYNASGQMKKCREDEANHLFILSVLYSPDTRHTNAARDTLTTTHHRHRRASTKRANRLAVFRLTVSVKFIDWTMAEDAGKTHRTADTRRQANKLTSWRRCCSGNKTSIFCCSNISDATPPQKKLACTGLILHIRELSTLTADTFGSFRTGGKWHANS